MLQIKTEGKEVGANVTAINENNENSETNNSNTTENQTQSNDAKKTEDNVNKAQFIFPVEGEVIKEFAKDNLIYSETLRRVDNTLRNRYKSR